MNEKDILENKDIERHPLPMSKSKNNSTDGDKDIILEMRGITKLFPGVKALDNVTFSVLRGEIHCLVGENGAGKSTLMKVLSGVHSFGSYSGDIVVNNNIQKYSVVNDSEKAGIAIIYQELALIPELSIYENIFLGHEIQKNGVIDWNETIKEAGFALKKVGLSINPSTQIKDLGVGQQQLVEIAKALTRDVKILILDEPTAALNEDDCDNLLFLLKDLKSQGVTSIMITHKLKEIIQIADTVTVLRDGQTICSLDSQKGEVTESKLIKNMVGREIDNIYPSRVHKISDDILFEVKNWNAFDTKLGREILYDISMNIKKGEIVGFSGLMGAGRTEFARSVFGNPDNYIITGSCFVDGKKFRFDHPKDAIKQGMAYVSEDRKGNGLILTQDIKENITIANLKELEKNFVIDDNAEIKIATEYVKSIGIKTPSIEMVIC